MSFQLNDPSAHNAAVAGHQLLFIIIRAILSNPDLLSKTPWKRLFENDFWGTPLSDSGSHGSYRPLCVLTFRLNHLLGGSQPWGYHLVNVLLHCLATALLIRVARLILPKSKQKAGSAVAGLVFATHPIHTETVAGVVGRADLAACNFYFLSLLAYIAHVRYRDVLCCCRKNQSDARKYHRLVFALQKNVTSCNWPKRHIRDMDAAEREVLVSKTNRNVMMRNFSLCCLRDKVKLWTYIGLCLLLALAAMLSKETGITVLGVCFVYDVVYNPRNKKQTNSLLILASALSVILAVRLQTRTPQFSTADNPTAREANLLARFLTFCYLPVFNFWLLIFPNTLSFDWGMEAIPRITSLRDGRNALSFVFYCGLGHALLTIVKNLKEHKRHKMKDTTDKSACEVCHVNCYDVHSPSCRSTNNNNTTNFHSTSCVCQRIKTAHRTDSKRVTTTGSILFSIALLALPFLPATNILFYVGFVVAERVLYIPSAGLCLLLGLASATFWNRYRKYRPVLWFVLVVALLAFSAKTVRRNRDWHDEESLYKSAIAVNPPKAYGNLGSVLSSQGRVAEAEWAFRKALQFRPNMADVHYNL
ncbi:hypothetical protein NQ315_007645 [Exocentrus adspersus]|uniref:dolichyl-phosphate-mannose--protein mannosyltransferase n=1 Tax=Exocentrus adspersus TaxID=1586481 RepID=A0AAV8W7I7_9CUCU|nr:hypothetical protein NQ315_007645 [Exocentrus adspersus]